MDKALACHAGGRGLNLDKTVEEFFCLEKNQICAPIPLGTPRSALSPKGLFLRQLRVNLLLWRQKREQHGKILAAPSVEAKHRTKAMYGKGVKNTLKATEITGYFA